MLVEDDNNLREIYEARLLAEGYEIVSAHDGEEALALAVKEKPDLIIADVMMPKISGFDMLDILRSTPESKDTKVIMMTALSQAEDKARADKLGADRYLVKSQVTLEDVAKIAREVLEESGISTSATPAPTSDDTSAQTPAEPAAASTLTPDPVASNPVPEPVITPEPTVAPVVSTDPVSAPDEPASQGPTTITFDPSAVPGAPASTSSDSSDDKSVIMPLTPEPVSPQPISFDPAAPVTPVAEPVTASPEPSSPSPVSIPITVVDEPVATPPAMPADPTPAQPVTTAPEPAPAQSQPAPQVITPNQAPTTPGPDPNLISL